MSRHLKSWLTCPPCDDVIVVWLPQQQHDTNRQSWQLHTALHCTHHYPTCAVTAKQHSCIPTPDIFGRSFTVTLYRTLSNYTAFPRTATLPSCGCDWLAAGLVCPRVSCGEEVEMIGFCRLLSGVATIDVMRHPLDPICFSPQVSWQQGA